MLLENQPLPRYMRTGIPQLRAQTSMMLLVAFVVGFVAPYSVFAYPLTIFIPLMWAWSASRFVSGLVLVSYYVGATWVAVSGWQSYAQLDLVDTLLRAGVWLALVGLASLPWVVLHRSDDRWLITRLGLLFAITVIPPFGLIQLANPFTGSSLILPAMGWVSVVIGIVLTGFVAKSPRLIILIFACLALTAVYGTKPRQPANWQAFNTEIPQGNFLELQAPTYFALRAAGKKARTDRPNVLLLGESTMGASPLAAKMATGDLGDTTLLLGAHDHTSTPPRSTMAVISESQAEVVYQQRVPVPLAGGLWPKWHSPVVQVGNRKIAPLICYEGVSSWATISALALKPDVVAVLANGAWTMHSGRLEQALHAHLGAWAAVFDRPYIVAINRRPDDLKENSQ